MRDEMDARLWDSHGRQFSKDLDRFIEAIRVTFRRMAAINFSAPWRKTVRDC